MAESTGQNNVTSDSKPKKIWNRDWWNRRTKLERTLLLITVTSLLLVFIMAVTLAAIGYLYQKNTNSLQELNSICLTPGCVRSAAEILLNTEDSIDPCEDFYEFSCRGWINRQTIPENKTSVFASDKMVDDLKQRLRVFIETLSESEPEFIKMLKWMYDSCMDLKSIENFGADPLKNVLKSLGGWPVLEGRKWKERYFNWIDTLKAIRKRGYSHNILIGLSVRPDHKNKVNVITLDRPNLEISDRSHFHNGLNDSTTSAYLEMMVKSAMLLGVGETTSRNEMLKALQFETTLANIILPHGERNDEINQKYTIKKLQQEFPQIPWLKYFDSLLNDKVYENETVIVYDPYYIRRFAELMASTEKRVVSNYMLWRVVHQSMYLLSKEWRNLELEYEFIVTGQREEQPRWKHCLAILENHLIVATSSYYLKRHLTEEMEDALLELVKYTKTEFLNILEEVDWMNKTAKQQIINKFRNMKVDIGYPKELRNTTALTEYYKNLKITNESYFENILSYRKWNSDFYISKLRKPYAEEKWMSKPGVSTIFTSYDGKTVGFSPAILDPSVLGKNSPQYINFGSMGSFIGFVFAAAFEIGSKEEHDGNKPSGEKTDDIFWKNVQCFYDEYSNNAEDVMAVEVVISMTGGLKNAYRAYRSWVKDHGNEQLLPGLKYTQNQMFWISAAYKFCEKKQPEGNELSTALDDQNSASYRVNGPMSNLPEFAKDFSCPPDSPMNKKDRCKIW